MSIRGRLQSCCSPGVPAGLKPFGRCRMFRKLWKSTVRRASQHARCGEPATGSIEATLAQARGTQVCWACPRSQLVARGPAARAPTGELERCAAGPIVRRCQRASGCTNGRPLQACSPVTCPCIARSTSSARHHTNNRDASLGLRVPGQTSACAGLNRARSQLCLAQAPSRSRAQH
jgi:hypothetical protein